MTEKVATVESDRQGGGIERELPGVKVRLETVFQLTVATQRLSEDRGDKGRKGGKEKGGGTIGVRGR